MDDSEKVSLILDVLEHLWPENKAKGHVTEIQFSRFFEDAVRDAGCKSIKYVGGIWLLSPHSSTDFWKLRHAFIVLPELNLEEPTGEEVLEEIEKRKEVKAVLNFLESAGIQPVLAVPVYGREDFFGDLRSALEAAATSRSGKLKKFSENLGLEFDLFAYAEGSVKKYYLSEGGAQESVWRGAGRKGHANWREQRWTEDTRKRLETALGDDVQRALELLMWELFYSVYFKTILQLPAQDPYDVDGFILAEWDKEILVFPVEIKEKEPYTRNGREYFGIDAGRVFLLLRLAVPAAESSNAFYIVHHVQRNDNGTTPVGWKIISLGKLLMDAGWNLQRGGRGMTGGETQTVPIPLSSYKEVYSESFCDFISETPPLLDEVKKFARTYLEVLRELFITGIHDGE